MSDEIAARLQHVRTMYGLSQRELAKRAGVTNSSVSMIEQGRVSPSCSSLEKLLSAIPMTLKDFFTLEYQNQQRCFYRGFEMYHHTTGGVDSYHLPEFDDSTENAKPTLMYQVYEPGSTTGEAMLVAHHKVKGFIVQGALEVTISGQFETLDAGDGFSISPLGPYRLANTSRQKAIVVINYSFSL